MATKLVVMALEARQDLTVQACSPDPDRPVASCLRHLTWRHAPYSCAPVSEGSLVGSRIRRSLPVATASVEALEFLQFGTVRIACLRN